MRIQQNIVTLIFKPGEIVYIMDLSSGKPMDMAIVQSESTARPGWYFCRTLRRKDSGNGATHLHCVNWASLKLFERPHAETRPATLEEYGPAGV